MPAGEPVVPGENVRAENVQLVCRKGACDAREHEMNDLDRTTHRGERSSVSHYVKALATVAPTLRALRIDPARLPYYVYDLGGEWVEMMNWQSC